MSQDMYPGDSPQGAPGGGGEPWGMKLPTFLLVLHLSQLAGYVIPVLGLVLPIVMWATNKDQFPEVDQHGRVIFNWMVSALIYGAIFFVLIFLLIGFPLLIALGICAIVFPIIGAIKANEGALWRYPGSIRFFG